MDNSKFPPVILHTYLLCPPGRTVKHFMDIAKIPYTEKIYDWWGGELLSEEFQALSPTGMAPVIEDGDFVLAESAAIINYLTATRNVP